VRAKARILWWLTVRGVQIFGEPRSAILGLKIIFAERILKQVALIGKLFGRSKGEPVEIKASVSFVPDKLFRRATKRIFAKYKVTIRKLGP
jgi:hypothetical protein